MSTLAKANYSMTAKHVGPIIELNGTLSNKDQNLIFARNGTGKSFLSRAFRYLYLNSRGEDISEAPNALVSDESTDGSAEFAFSQGDKTLGSLKINKLSGNVEPMTVETIFHVFSDEFVQEELRTRHYEINGEIENEIAIDSENIKITQKEEEIIRVKEESEESQKALIDKFSTKRNELLSSKAGVNKLLTEYKDLNIEEVLNDTSILMPEKKDRTFKEILNELDKLKSLPAEPVLPSIVNADFIDWEFVGDLRASLVKITSPSSIAEDMKSKIDRNHDFYEMGVNIIEAEGLTDCPLCEQSITSSNPKLMIDTYVRYFADEEEKHKKKLRGFYSNLARVIQALPQITNNTLKQKSDFDNLKSFIPSKSKIEIVVPEKEIDDLVIAAKSIQSIIEEKANNLGEPIELPDKDLGGLTERLDKIIQGNNDNVNKLASSIEKSDEERRGLQREACKIFFNEFIIKNWVEIEEIRRLKSDLKTKEKELSELEKANPSNKARDRVAETFETLLREFFGDKYLFDKDRFTLTRGDHEMARGIHRTLSDGEKTAIAFCYFVAGIHRNVSANSDYEKLYLVFDDPVTSMSYDYVFSIAQTLKNLNVSKSGEISVNPGKIDGNNYRRPRLLILTHSTYFFNISFSNRVINESKSAFSLNFKDGRHELSKLSKYVAPFHQQLRDVYKVSEGQEPDHSTGNAIRSVLEAVGRFCRPDKADSLSNFITFLAAEENITLKSVLINSLSHGSFYEETPSPADLTMACQETITVVERFATGQLELARME